MGKRVLNCAVREGRLRKVLRAAARVLRFQFSSRGSEKATILPQVTGRRPKQNRNPQPLHSLCPVRLTPQPAPSPPAVSPQTCVPQGAKPPVVETGTPSPPPGDPKKRRQTHGRGPLPAASVFPIYAMGGHCHLPRGPDSHWSKEKSGYSQWIIINTVKDKNNNSKKKSAETI